MTRHILRTVPAYFQAVWEGRKTFEVRYDDRGYQAGDTVVLREYDRMLKCECPAGSTHGTDCIRYSGREIDANVPYVLASTPSYGSAPHQRGFNGNGFVVLSLANIGLTDKRPGDRPVFAFLKLDPTRPSPADMPKFHPGGVVGPTFHRMEGLDDPS